MTANINDIKVVSYEDGGQRHTHILRLTSRYVKNLEKSPLPEGLSGKDLVQEMRKRGALYNDLTKEEARALAGQGLADIVIPGDEGPKVPSIYSTFLKTGAESSRGHWQMTEEEDSCALRDPEPYSKDRITAAVRYYNEENGELAHRTYFPEGRESDPAPGVAASANVKGGFEYEQFHMLNGMPYDHYPDELIVKYGSKTEKGHRMDFSKMSISDLEKIRAAKTVFDRATKNPVYKMHMIRALAQDPVDCRIVKKDGSREVPVFEKSADGKIMYGNRTPSEQWRDAVTGDLLKANSFQDYTRESALSAEEIDAFNRARRDTAAAARSYGSSGSKPVETAQNIGHYL